VSFLARAACDICGTPKGETNHWRCFSRKALEKGRLHIFAWSERRARIDGSLCSEDCAHKLLNRYLGGQLSDR
jgi:hypothetical protein